MAIDPRKIRELFFQILFTSPESQEEKEGLLKLLMKEQNVTRKSILGLFLRYEEFQKVKNEIEGWLKNLSKEYAWERVTKVEQTAIFLGAFELFFDHHLPGKVAITEAVRIAKKYGSKEASKYVNAILDDLYHQRERSA